MKSYFSVILAVSFLIACNNSENAADNEKKDSSAVAVNGDTTTMPAYDPALEPLNVGAKYSKVLGDTLNIKMYEFTVKPGDSVALHAHPDHTVYVVEGGTAMLGFNGGPLQEMQLKTGMGFISGALTDYGKNTGTTTIKLIVTDIYRPRGK